MTKAQQKHLREQLQCLYAAKVAKIPSKYGFTPKYPRHIAIAARLEKKYEKMVQRWKDAQYKKNDRARDAVKQACSQVESLILFGTSAQALAALKKFEKQR